MTSFTEPTAQTDPSPSNRAGPAVTVIVLVAERPEPLAELYAEYAPVLRNGNVPFEFLFVVGPGWTPLVAPLAALVRAGEPIEILEVGSTLGATGSLKLAAPRARGGVIITMPAYRRIEPAGLLTLVRGVEQGADLVVAQRWPRRDSWINRLQNRVFHRLLNWFVGGNFRDVACGVAAARPELLRELPLLGDTLRFLPILAAREGYAVDEVPIPQHRGDTGARVYGPGIYVRRVMDVFGLYFLMRFTEKPLRFFGLVGSTLSLAGFVLLVVLAVQRLGGQPIANRPLLVLAVLLCVLGVQAIALGLIGEIIVHLHAGGRRPYRLRRVVPPSE